MSREALHWGLQCSRDSREHCSPQCFDQRRSFRGAAICVHVLTPPTLRQALMGPSEFKYEAQGRSAK
ncbi:hypothetical protein PF005_g12494 [Phytophthora fragariae]|uniref:Uncharacterized protein n=1 Tax=Phytophthora fragariae TaxID=53985 RepID=A0A6A3YVM0_9STRA|nr:hypothetical protein PF009_g13946 [Phytophthora fragariae]KAE9005246.1 hypothetical protein PF011_g12124 [Phytophthora fragariae]KAE9107157.1 hypothetical protein PF010_g12372 [Phytophthora fragariae]KAE9107998.1 hypothetical protein PF007_g12826 [Phytophthora fragariae]KAE9142510.1 hypothetical protein PF006_g12388 [Phytophthora fragariae]